MKSRIVSDRRARFVILGILAGAALSIALPARAAAQFGPPPGPPPPAREAAPIDLTGYWVSIVTEDWRFRIILAPRGDAAGVPLNPAGIEVMNSWNPDQDEADGLQCKAYGAAGIMRMPGRLHITWVDENTLQIEADAGTQTRLVHFGDVAPPTGEPTWQGHSVGEWVSGGPGAGALKITTTHMRAGYLRRNGVPYGERTVMTEYIDLVHEASGKDWVVVKTLIQDPEFLFGRYVTSPNFRRELNDSGWKPTPCQVR